MEWNEMEDVRVLEDCGRDGYEGIGRVGETRESERRTEDGGRRKGDGGTGMGEGGSSRRAE